MHWTHRTYEEKKEERPPRSVVRQTGLTWTQKMRITPSKLFFGTIQISCQYPLLVKGTLAQLNKTKICLLGFSFYQPLRTSYISDDLAITKLSVAGAGAGGALLLS